MAISHLPQKKKASGKTEEQKIAFAISKSIEEPKKTIVKEAFKEQVVAESRCHYLLSKIINRIVKNLGTQKISYSQTTAKRYRHINRLTKGQSHYPGI